ncbi:hypothetical protein KEM52_004371, partial [Ascosphaera acerosa]
MVLLKNEPVDGAPLLPIADPARLRRVAVIGRLADVANTGDRGSSYVHTPAVVTPLQGLRAALADTRCEIVHDDGADVARATAAARGADLVLCVVGYDHRDEGEYAVPSVVKDPALQRVFPPTTCADDERVLAVLRGESDEDTAGTALDVGAGGDRASLRLHADEEALIAAVAAANRATVVSIVAAGAVLTEAWRGAVPAVLLSWYSGCEGGHALADVLLGRGGCDAAGRLPFSIPTSEAHLPAFDREATTATYDRWFGQALLDRLGVRAAFPLGFGLSYTAFAVRDVRARAWPALERIDVQLTVANTGARPGRHVAQVYARP